MKFAERIISVVLVLAFAAGMTGCAEKGFSHKTLIKTAKKLDLSESGSTREFCSISSNHWQECYISVTGYYAQDLYDTFLNHFETFPDYDVTEATGINVFDTEKLYMICLLTFENGDTAEKFYGKFADEYASDGDSGEDKNYSYTICRGTRQDGRATMTGVYLCGSTVLTLRGSSDDPVIADAVCSAYKIISPLEA